MKALAQAARKQKVNELPEVKQQLALSQEQVLASSFYQSLARSAKPSEAGTRKYFEEHKTEFEQAKARHILIRFQGSRVPLKPGQQDLTEAESLAKAQEVRAKLMAGGDFAALAKAESDDTGSGANGGDLGNFGRGRMVPQFDEVVFSLPPGEISQPTKTQFGYHLIQVQERSTKSFDEARDDIEKKLGPAEAKRVVEQIRKDAHVVLDEKYFPAK
jgi:parvulin-like peptidyl-prolyl isomerase